METKKEITDFAYLDMRYDNQVIVKSEMQSMNKIKNSTVIAGIDIGSENIYCAIGSFETEKNSKIKLLGIGNCQ